jgi:hypothetical protein
LGPQTVLFIERNLLTPMSSSGYWCTERSKAPAATKPPKSRHNPHRSSLKAGRTGTPRRVHMLKKAIILAIAVAAIAAAAIPAAASASWQHHAAQLQANANLQITGQAKFQGEIGWMECQANVVGQLTAGTTTGDVQAFGADVVGSESVTDHCAVGGGLASLGCTDVASTTAAGLPWTIHATGATTITLTTGTIQGHLHGGFFCPKTVQITPGTIHISTATEQTVETGQLSGQLQVDPSIGGSQSVTISGHGNVVQGKATFGL